MKATGILALFTIAFPIVLASPTPLIPRTNSIFKRGDHESDRVYSSSENKRYHDEDYDYDHEKHAEFIAYDTEQEHKANEMEALLRKVVDCPWQPKSENNDWNIEERGKDECEQWSEEEESGEREEVKENDKGHYHEEQEKVDMKRDKEERKEDVRVEEEGHKNEDHEGGRKKDSEWQSKCTYPSPAFTANQLTRLVPQKI
jgi:hypothetical protein